MNIYPSDHKSGMLHVRGVPLFDTAGAAQVLPKHYKVMTNHNNSVYGFTILLLCLTFHACVWYHEQKHGGDLLCYPETQKLF